jgi:hypothetical protein
MIALKEYLIESSPLYVKGVASKIDKGIYRNMKGSAKFREDRAGIILDVFDNSDKLIISIVFKSR